MIKQFLNEVKKNFVGEKFDPKNVLIMDVVEHAEFIVITFVLLLLSLV